MVTGWAHEPLADQWDLHMRVSEDRATDVGADQGFCFEAEPGRPLRSGSQQMVRLKPKLCWNVRFCQVLCMSFLLRDGSLPKHKDPKLLRSRAQGPLRSADGW